MYTDYHNARQEMRRWEEIPGIQEVRGEGPLQTQESKKSFKELRRWSVGRGQYYKGQEICKHDAMESIG